MRHRNRSELRVSVNVAPIAALPLRLTFHRHEAPMPENQIDDPLASRGGRGGESNKTGIARYVVIFAVCLFAIYYAYTSSSDGAVSESASQQSASSSASAAPDAAVAPPGSPNVAAAKQASPTPQ